MSPAAFRLSIAIVVALSVWLGAVLYFIAVVAPAAFRALPTRTLAGALVGQTLPAIFVSGIVAGLLVAGLAIAGGSGMPHRVVRLVCGLVVALLCAVAQFVIGSRIDRLLASIGTVVDTLPPGDPVRATFGRLHALSVASLGVAALVALAVLVISLMTLGGQAT